MDDEDKLISEWEKRRYRPGPGEPDLPPQLRQMRGKSAEEAAAELKKLPFFMTELDENEPNELVDALQALAFEGEPDEVASNFKYQGNECYRANRYKDAIEYYTKAINVKCDVKEINLACLLNRAACNLELRNYRKCINDCKLALTLDDKNIKALFRSARAYHAVDRNDEAIDCLVYAISLDSSSESLKALLKKCEARRTHLIELEQKRKAKEEVKSVKKRNLQLAIESRNYTLMRTSKGGSGTGGKELEISLEDVMDPHSELLVPVMCLYPLEMQSDMIQPQSDEITVNQNLEMLFDSPPEWASSDYKLENLEVYAQTESGGLAKVGKKSSIRKVLSTKSPVLPVIDNTCRLYIVPKNRSKEFLSSWVKQSAANQLHYVS